MLRDPQAGAPASSTYRIVRLRGPRSHALSGRSFRRFVTSRCEKRRLARIMHQFSTAAARKNESTTAHAKKGRGQYCGVCPVGIVRRRTDPYPIQMHLFIKTQFLARSSTNLGQKFYKFCKTSCLGRITWPDVLFYDRRSNPMFQVRVGAHRGLPGEAQVFCVGAHRGLPYPGSCHQLADDSIHRGRRIEALLSQNPSFRMRAS